MTDSSRVLYKEKILGSTLGGNFKLMRPSDSKKIKRDSSDRNLYLLLIALSVVDNFGVLLVFALIVALICNSFGHPHKGKSIYITLNTTTQNYSVSNNMA